MIQVFGFDLDRETQFGLLKRHLDVMGQTIQEELVDPAVACRIYEAHVTSESEHSCLGCNLNESVFELASFLSAETLPASELTRLFCVLNLINTVWERKRDICEAVQMPAGLWDQDSSKFRAFKQLRAWTNFMKHPNFFGLGIHHPIYVVAGSVEAAEASRKHDKTTKAQVQWLLINTDVVGKYWQGNGKAIKSFRNEFPAAITACVVLPDMAEFANSLCAEFTGFVDRMTEPTWIEQARNHSLAKMSCDWWE